MLAVHLEQGVVSLREGPLPDRPPGFARIRMLVAGICNTDLELQRGYYGFSGTPGHEFVGVVLDADDQKLVGKRVAGEINLSCGQCEWCRRGLGRHCPTRTVLGIVQHPGSFAEYILLPEGNLHVVSDSIPSEHAVFIEPLAAACEILDQVSIAHGDRVAVLGDGKLGLLIAQVLAAHCVHVIHYGRHAAKLAIAASSDVEAIQVSPDSPLPRAEFQYVVDATGSPDGLRAAVHMVRPRGTVILKSTVHGHVPIDTAGIIVNEITLVGSRCGRFEPAIRLLEQGSVRVGPLVSGEFGLDHAPEAFAEAAKRGVLKVLLRNPA
jgi:threonine dehydrogenase-like Zn-dependent dehydrogenase